MMKQVREPSWTLMLLAEQELKPLGTSGAYEDLPKTSQTPSALSIYRQSTETKIKQKVDWKYKPGSFMSFWLASNSLRLFTSSEKKNNNFKNYLQLSLSHYQCNPNNTRNKTFETTSFSAYHNKYQAQSCIRYLVKFYQV